MGEIILLEKKIAESRRASAVQRAWEVTKSLESDKNQFGGLRWVEPEYPDGITITRKIDFTDYPTDAIPFVPMDISVRVPASVIVPGEDITVNWTMPLLTRISEPDNNLDNKVKQMIGYKSSSYLRPTIDVVSFLPFPRANAPKEEQFKPEFYVTLEINYDLGEQTNYFAAVTKYNGKVTKQFVTDGAPRFIGIFAVPKTKTYFNAEMLVNLSQEELANTPENAGVLEIFIYRITENKLSLKKINKLGYLDALPNSKESEISQSSERLKLGYDNGYLNHTSQSVFPDESTVTRGLTVVKGSKGQGSSNNDIADVTKEVGDVRLGEGTTRENVKYDTLELYGYDGGFGVQRLSIRFLGVREGSKVEAEKAIRFIATQYKG